VRYFRYMIDILQFNILNLLIVDAFEDKHNHNFILDWFREYKKLYWDVNIFLNDLDKNDLDKINIKQMVLFKNDIEDVFRITNISHHWVKIKTVSDIQKLNRQTIILEAILNTTDTLDLLIDNPISPVYSTGFKNNDLHDVIFHRVINNYRDAEQIYLWAFPLNKLSCESIRIAPLPFEYDDILLQSQFWIQLEK